MAKAGGIQTPTEHRFKIGNLNYCSEKKNIYCHQLYLTVVFRLRCNLESTLNHWKNSMEKKFTSSLLLLSFLTVMLCTTAKSSENEKVSPAILGIKPEEQTPEHKEALAKFKQTVTKFQEQIKEVPQRTAQEETDGKKPLPKQNPNPDEPGPTHQASPSQLFLRHFASQNNFYFEGEY